MHTPVWQKNFRLWPFLLSAAAILALALGTWLYLIPSYAPKPSVEFSVSDGSHIAPGKNTATLTLPNGKLVNLSETKTGVVIDVAELRYDDGEELGISSEPVGPLKNGSQVSSKTPQFPNGLALSGSMNDGVTGDKLMNISTPRGGTYQVVLPDGTKVWLNAASSLRFPVSFKGAKRRVVELTGEAYFAVHKSPDVPFIVKSHGQEAVVLGTEFNINSYFDEEHIKTTLVNGSLKVNAAGGKSVLLAPGQESLLDNLQLHKRPADIALATSWMEGTFYFNKTPFGSMMRQVSRWYNVDVVYLSKRLPDIRFTGEIKRDVMLQTVLTYIQDLGVQLHVKGRTLYIE